jgi:hypothetical protein
VSARVDIEELQTTKTEKLLAAVLAVFLLIGGVWAYQEIDDWVKGDPQFVYQPPSDPAIERRDAARQRAAAARDREARALQELELRREAYRTALDANRPAPGLERAYVSAQRAYREAQRAVATAQQELRAAEPAAAAAERRLSGEVESQRRREERNTFLWRLVLVLAAIGVAYLLLWHLHGLESRYLPLGFAAVAGATVLALVMAGDYLTDYFDPLDLGPFILALVGSVLTIAAFFGLQRYLARRLPTRRVRKGQCPFCGYPAGGDPRCEGCGRELVAPCARCNSDRRVGTLHCRTCGAM